MSDEWKQTSEDSSTATRSPQERTIAQGDIFLPLGDISGVPSLGDPFSLRKAKKSPEDLQRLRKKGTIGKRVLSFYKKQNQLIETLLQPPGHRDEDEDAQLFKLKVAIYGSAAVNLALVVLQITAAVASGSLAILATAADALMDVASSIVIVIASRAASNRNLTKFPTGKNRMETAGVIVFSTLMATVSIQVIIEAVKTLGAGEKKPDLSILSISCIGVALVLKIFLFLYCRLLIKYPTARILAQDHRNDIAMNSLGIGLSFMGAYLKWWIDPMGAILISLFILRTWTATGLENIHFIVGKAADPSFIQKLVYTSVVHDSRILQVDTCRAYHSGNRIIAEVDIVLPPEMPLKEAHDIGESLQMTLEKLEDVERAFVHIDYETEHKPEH